MDLSSQTIDVQPGRFPRSFHVVAKPLGSRCNLDCVYCYYLHKKAPVHSKGDSPIFAAG